MDRDRIAYILAVVLVGVPFASGCSTTMKLRYQKPPAAHAARGDIRLLVEDQRPPDRGGNEALRVGTVRNAFGMPFPLRADPARDPSRVVEELVADCLEASGYRVVEASARVPQLHATLETFWTDGYQHSRMILKLPLELRRDAGAGPVWSHELESNTGVTWTAGYSQFDRGFSAMLDAAEQELLVQFESEAFRKGYESLR